MKIKKYIYWIFLALITLVALSVALTGTNSFTKYRLFVVKSGSMEPEIMKNSLVLIKEQQDYFEGDIINYYPLNSTGSTSSQTITHRIINKEAVGGNILFTTQGDANNVADLDKVSSERIVGKVTYEIPHLGWLIGYAKTQVGFILIIIIPATLFIYGELIVIRDEAKKLIKESKKRKLTKAEKIELEIGKEIIEIEKKIQGSKSKTKNKKKKETSRNE